jgi:hypothetical protein
MDMVRAEGSTLIDPSNHQAVSPSLLHRGLPGPDRDTSIHDDPSGFVDHGRVREGRGLLYK